MKNPLRLASALAALGLLSACVTATPVGRTVITEEESKIVFYDPQTTRMESRFYREKSVGRGHRYYLSTWMHPSKSFPQARIFYTELVDGYHYPKAATPSEGIDNLNFGEETEIRKFDKGTTKTVLGKVKYQRFSAGPASCIAFTRFWKDRYVTDTITAGNKSVEGHFCAASGKILPVYRIREILHNIGIVGTALPQPSEEWKRGKAKNEKKKAMEIPIALEWPALGADVSGKFLVDALSTSGKVWLSPGRGVNCAGDWKTLSGVRGSSDPARGEWSVLCNNGLTAKGDFLFDHHRAVSGSGRDSDDNPISFSPPSTG